MVNEIIFVRSEGENIAKSHPVDYIDPTTNIILERNNQGKFVGIVEKVRTLVHGSFSYVLGWLHNLGSTMRRRRGYYWLLFFRNCHSLFSILCLTSPVLQIFLSWIRPPQMRVFYSSRESFPQGSSPCVLKGCTTHLNLSFGQFDYFWFIVNGIQLTMASCSPYTIIVNRTENNV